MIVSKVNVTDDEKKLLEAYRQYRVASMMKYDDSLQKILVHLTTEAINTAVREWFQLKDVGNKKLQEMLSAHLVEMTQMRNKDLLQHIVARVIEKTSREGVSFFEDKED